MSDMGFYAQVAVWSDVLGSFAFLAVLVYLFNRFVSPAVVASQARKNAELSDAEQRRDAAKADVAAAQAELDAAKRDVQAITQRAQLDAHRERERILAEAKGDGERLVSNAEGELDRRRAGARVALRAELVEKALIQARASAAARIGANKDHELVEGVMAAIGEGAEAVPA
ncbi:MAG TPA: ATP synthase F0 subunit B [Candidatus Baltobacteraceae bacterium]